MSEVTPAADAVAARLAAVRARIAAACARAGRDPQEVTLIGASKRQPPERLRAAIDAGLRVLGENQVQEAVAKSAELPLDVDWQLIGHLQSNKVKPAVRLFSTIHSLDRPKIIHRLEREAARQGRRLRGFLEVNLGAEPSKHGFAAADLVAAAAPFAALERIEIVGLMAIPPYEENPEDARRWFRQLRALRDELAARSAWQRPGFGALSMGMSHDFEVAIEEGATHVRIGTAIFGPRPA
ncbi:MAG: YggS family pyridoxal phosphate-dependent enzyme [Acidobacteria bacterium]|nr:MAG: YggS family pyridoxal phosphate-dependent enzyme [Acidobacteriota bacterium]